MNASDPKLVLHYAPIACSMVPWICLTEAGAAFETVRVDLKAGQQMSAEFLRLNPKHRVPVLVIDGEPLTENVAILQWLDRRFPQAALMPTEPMAYTQATSLLAWFASGIHPALTPNALPQRFCDLPDSADSVRRCAQKLLVEYLAIAEQRLAGRDWFFDARTCVDIYFYWCLRRMQQFGIDLAPYAACSAHFARVQARPAVQSLLAFEAETLRAFAH